MKYRIYAKDHFGGQAKFLKEFDSYSDAMNWAEENGLEPQWAQETETDGRKEMLIVCFR